MVRDNYNTALKNEPENQNQDSWNFWSTAWVSAWSFDTNTSCAGIIFDPCIILEFPESRIHDEIYFWTKRLYKSANDIG
jgi:hypothetical protein